MLPPQHRHLLVQYQQLGILRRRRTRQQRYPSGQADEDQVKHPYGHEPVILPAEQPSRQGYSQVSQPSPFWNPTGEAVTDLGRLAGRSALQSCGGGAYPLALVRTALKTPDLDHQQRLTPCHAQGTATACWNT
jgi:hypothetical protein